LLLIRNSRNPELRLRELEDYLYAEYLGLGCPVIELGYKFGKVDDSPGRTLLKDIMSEKNKSQTLTRQDQEHYLHATLANGFGEDVLFNTPESKWGDSGDQDLVKQNLEIMELTIQEQNSFIQKSRAQARQFFSKPEVVEQLRRAYKPLAEKHWKGRIGPVRIARYLEEGK